MKHIAKSFKQLRKRLSPDWVNEKTYNKYFRSNWVIQERNKCKNICTHATEPQWTHRLTFISMFMNQTKECHTLPIHIQNTNNGDIITANKTKTVIICMFSVQRHISILVPIVLPWKRRWLQPTKHRQGYKYNEQNTHNLCSKRHRAWQQQLTSGEALTLNQHNGGEKVGTNASWLKLNDSEHR